MDKECDSSSNSASLAVFSHQAVVGSAYVTPCGQLSLLQGRYFDILDFHESQNFIDLSSDPITVILHEFK